VAALVPRRTHHRLRGGRILDRADLAAHVRPRQRPCRRLPRPCRRGGRRRAGPLDSLHRRPPLTPAGPCTAPLPTRERLPFPLPSPMPTTTSPIRSDRVGALPPYLFVDIDRKRRARLAAGADVINLGIGDPDRPTPWFIIEALHSAAEDPANHRYPDGRGSGAFRQAAARFMQRRFGVSADPDRHICAIIGSKEAVFHLPLAIVNPG